MSDKPQNKAKSTDHLSDKASEKKALEPQIAKESQTDAKGQQKIELQRTNRHDGTAGKSDQGDMESVRIESIDEHGKKRVVSRKDGGSERDLLRADRKKESSEKLSDQLPPDRPAGGYDEIHNADGGITLKGVIPGPGEELENITTGTMEAMASENALVKNALEMRKQIDQHMEPGPERDKIVDQLKADVTASLMSGGLGESEIGGTHKAITDGGIETDSDKPENKEQDWQSVIEKISQLPIDKQFQIIGTGLLSFNNELEHQKLEIALGTVEGIGEGFKSIGEGVVSLADGIGQIAQFGSDVMTNNPRAIETGAQAGEAIGKTLVGGVRLFQMSHDYLYNIGFTGDYAKPFNDIANLGEQLDKTWQEIPTRERAKLASKLSTEVLGSLAIPLGVSKVAKSERLVKTLEEIATKAKSIGKGAKEKTGRFIGEIIDDLTQPVGVTPDGQRIRIPKEPQKAESLHMSKPDDSRVNQPGKHIEGADRVRLSEGFYVELGKAFDSLSLQQKEFLRIKGVRIKPVRRMTDVPGADINMGGGYRANEIYLPEEIMQNGHWVKNDDLSFRLHHEVGHAFNEASGELSGIPISDKRAFREAFKKDLSNAPKEILRQLQLSQNQTEARDEIFSDLYSHINSPTPSNARYSQLIRSVFRNCFEHLSKEIKH